MKIRVLTIRYSKQKARNSRKKEQDLDDRMEELDNVLSQGNNADEIKGKQQEYIRLKQELSLLYENKRKGAMIRSKARWIEQGKQPTKCFFNLEKRNYNRKVIREVKRPEGEILHEEKDI